MANSKISLVFKFQEMEVCYLAWILFENIFYGFVLFCFKDECWGNIIENRTSSFTQNNLSTQVEGRKQFSYWVSIKPEGHGPHRLSAKQAPKTKRCHSSVQSSGYDTWHPCFQDKIAHFLISSWPEVGFAVWSSVTHEAHLYLGDCETSGLVFLED